MTRSGFPGDTSAVIITRPRSSKFSLLASVPSGPSISWSIAAAIVSPLPAVEWAMITRVPLVAEPSACSAAGQRSGGPRIALRLGERLVGDQLRLDHDRNRALEWLDLVGDRGHGTLGERDQPDGGDAHPGAGRRLPLRRTPKHSGPEVQHALVPAELAVADVERLVLHEQPDQLAVGHVDDRLAGVGEAVTRLGVGERPDLVEAAQVAAGEPERLALVEVAAQPDVAIREREHRLGLREGVEVELRLPQGPGLDGECRVLDHRQQLGQVPNHDVGPVRLQCLRLPDPVHADDVPEASSPPGVHSGQRVLEHGRLGRLDAHRSGAREVRVRRRLAGQMLALGVMAVDDLLEQLRDPSRFQHVAAVGARGDDGAPQPRVAGCLHVPDRSLVGLHALLMDHLQHDLVLAVAQPVDRLLVRRSRPACPAATRSPARRGTT